MDLIEVEISGAYDCVMGAPDTASRSMCLDQLIELVAKRKSQDIQTLDDFLKHGHQASYHYADDSTSEWAKGDGEKAAAIRLFDANPDLHKLMRVLARTFLWVLNTDRPEGV